MGNLWQVTEYEEEEKKNSSIIYKNEIKRKKKQEMKRRFREMEEKYIQFKEERLPFIQPTITTSTNKGETILDFSIEDKAYGIGDTFKECEFLYGNKAKIRHINPNTGRWLTYIIPIDSHELDIIVDAIHLCHLPYYDLNDTDDVVYGLAYHIEVNNVTISWANTQPLMDLPEDVETRFEIGYLAWCVSTYYHKITLPNGYPKIFHKRNRKPKIAGDKKSIDGNFM